MDLLWKSPNNLIAKIDGRELSIAGAALIEGDIHFMILPRYMTHWRDGAPLAADERDSIVRDVVEEANERGWNFVIG